MNKPVSRREFLAFLGIALLTLFGIPSLLRRLRSAAGDQSEPDVRSYGGRGKGFFR
jgi:hypothetical protein